jgi:multidrug efflux pump subunit AcrB
MNFATWSIRNPIPSVLLFILLSVAGSWGFSRLIIQNLPDMAFPTVNVTLMEPGAAPSQLETEVALKVENSLATLNGLHHITTSITDGLVSIQVQFVLEKLLSDALIETKNAVDSVRSELPADLLQPSVAEAIFAPNPIVTYSVASSRMDEEALSWFIDDTLSKAVLRLLGVDRLERLGGVQREVRVEADPVRMAALGVTAADLSHALRSVQQQSSGGLGRLGGAEQSIRTIALAKQASDLASLPIVLATGRQVRLDQVAVVQDAVAERTQTALLNQHAAVGFNVYRARGSDEIKVAEGVAQVVARLRAADPTLKAELVSGSAAHTLEQYEGSMSMLYEGALLAVVVVFFFLRNWRATLVGAAALPLSILPAFAAMHWLGYSLNTLTLLALAVVVGILVDDAIVEIENIERHRQMGKSILDAVKEAVTEIALAVMATTMALVVVFVPTTMMSGVGGLFFKQFGWTAVIAVLSSLLVARLLTPMMAASLLTGHSGGHESPDGRLMSRYLAAVRWCLDHRKTTTAAAIAFLVASIALIPLIPSGLIPPQDGDFTNVSVELPPGSPLDTTLAVAEAAQRALKDVVGVKGVFTTVGQGGQSNQGVQAGEVRRASLTLLLLRRSERPRLSEIEAEARRRLAGVPGARFTVGGTGPGNKLQLILASDNAEALKATAQGVVRDLRAVPGLSNISTTANLERPEIIVHPHPERAAELGFTAAALGEAVRVATSGDFDANLARLNLDARQVCIRVRLPDSARRNLDVLANMRVDGRNGPAPLSSIADVSLGSGPSRIDRYDRRRFVTIDADLAGTPLSVATAAAAALPSVRAMPSSVHLIQSGDAEMAAELSVGFGVALVVGVLCIFCVLVLLFGDFLQPITILSAIPLSTGGAFLALLITRTELDVPSMIGLVMLMGIVTKNSILLVEYAIVGMTERGLSRRDALVDACHKRARPIVMTTIAMIAGMMPITLGLGADSSFRRPMAVAVIGGLLTSTALSLLVVPVVFTYVDGFERRLRRWLGLQPRGRVNSSLSRDEQPADGGRRSAPA